MARGCVGGSACTASGLLVGVRTALLLACFPSSVGAVSATGRMTHRQSIYVDIVEARVSLPHFGMCSCVCSTVAVSFDLGALVSTSIFTTAAFDLLLSVADTTPYAPLIPGEDQLPVHRDVDPVLVTVTSTSSGVVRNADAQEAADILASAGSKFTTVLVRHDYAAA